MAKPAAGQNQMQGGQNLQNLQGVMQNANARRDAYRAQSGGQIPPGGQLPNQAALQAHYAQGQAAGQNMDWMKQQNPSMMFGQSQPQGGPQPQPQMGQPMLGLGGGNYMNALKPATSPDMPAPGGANFFSNMLQKTGQNPALGGPMNIRKPMPTQAPMGQPTQQLKTPSTQQGNLQGALANMRSRFGG